MAKGDNQKGKKRKPYNTRKKADSITIKNLVSKLKDQSQSQSLNVEPNLI